MFPDHSWPDHTGTVRTLSELQGRDPLILLLARGNYCPKHRRIDEALEAGTGIVSLFWGDPVGYVEHVHDANGVVLQTVGSAEEARRAAASGVDVVVAQGWEAGGHVRGQVATLPWVPAVVDAVAPVPVIAAGGIGDARGVAAVLALGAQAAWLGTRFLLAQEMPIHQ